MLFATVFHRQFYRDMTVQLLLLFLGFGTLQLFAQPDKFNSLNYPVDKYKIDTMFYNFKDTKIYIIKVSDRQIEYGNEEILKIWVQQFDTEKILSEKYMGETDTEHGYYIPQTQPLDNYFILVDCGEHNGIVNLISLDGQWIQLHGYYFSVDKKSNLFFTKAAGDMSQNVSKFDLITKKIIEKEWNNFYGEPWGDTLQYYYTKDKDWIK